MNRYQFEKAVSESGLGATHNHLLRYFAYKKHWVNDGQVWVSYSAVVRDTGLSLSTVKRRIPELRKMGWLVPTGRKVGQGAIVYDLAIPTGVTETLVLAGNNDEPEENQSHSDTSTSLTETPTGVTQTPTSVTVAPEYVKNKKEEVREEEVTTSPAATAPVDKKDYLQEQTLLDSPNLKALEHLENLLKKTLYTLEEKEHARSLFFNLEVRPELEGVQRAAWAELQASSRRLERIKEVKL